MIARARRATGGDAPVAGLTDEVGEQQPGLVGLGAALARQPGSLLGGGVAAPGRPVVGPAALSVVCGHLRSLSPRGVAWKPASSSARPSGESRTPAPSARSTVRRPSWPSRTASDSASTAGCSRCRVVGPGEQGAPAALDVEDQPSVDQHDEGAGLAARACGRRPRRRLGTATAPRRRTGWPGRSPRAPARAATRRALARGSSSARSRAAPTARSRSTAPGSANCAAPRPSTK